MRHRLLSLFLPLGGILFFSADRLAGQGSQADYDRAWRLEKETANKVYRDSVRPNWLPGNSQFWYRNDLPGGKREFVLVDLERGTRKVVDDPGKPLDALPVSEPRPSRRTGPETAITFINQTDGKVHLFWLDFEGKRRDYGSVAAKERRTQHTFGGHVWLATSERGQTLGVFEATDGGGEAVVDGKSSAERKPTPPKRPADESPDGRWRAFLRERNVWVKNLASGQETQLSTSGVEQDEFESRFHWSPDGKRLVVMQTRSGGEREVKIVEAAPKDQFQPRLHSFSYLKPGDNVPQRRPRLFDVAAGRQIPVPETLFENSWDVTDLHWQPDSSRFTFVFNQRGHQLLRLVSVDATTGESRTVLEERSPTFLDYAHKFFLRRLDDTQELLWMSERDGWNHLYLFDAETGRLKQQITRGEWVVRGVERVDIERRQIWFRASGIRPGQDPYYVHLARVNFDGSGLTVLTAGDGTHRWEFTPDGRYFLDRWSRVDLPTVTEVRRSDDGELVCELERGDASELLATGWRCPERFVAQGRDGRTEIYGVLIRPTNFDPAKKYPVVEEIYAGPHGAFVPKEFGRQTRQRAIAELGFVVVQIDGMGTSRRSKAFHDVCWKNLGDAGFPDRIAWLKAAAERFPELDLNRVGIYGGSAGGQNALRALLAHGDFYKVAVADCGCHDNRMDKIWWNELWMGWPIGPHYAEQSNVTNAHRLQGKLLLIVGEVDRNVDPASTLQVADAMVKANKDFDLLILPGVGHGAAETPYGSRRRMDFLVRHLLGVEPRGTGR